MSNIDPYIQKQNKAIEQAERRLKLAQRIKKNIERTRGLDGVYLMLAAHPDTERGLWGHGDYRKSTDLVVIKLEEIKAGGHGMRYLSNAPIIRDKIERYLGDISHRIMQEKVYRHLFETNGEELVRQLNQEIREECSSVPF